MKIKRTFMRDEAYNILQEWILIGELKPGEKLRDQDLSDLLGISRTPIREALLRLEDDGLVKTEANRWTLVSPINLEEAEDTYSIVQILECFAIEQGLENCTEDFILTLNEINEQFKNELEKGNRKEAFKVDQDFHEQLVQLSRNKELPKLLSILKIKIQRMEIHYFSTSDSSLESYQEHKEIIKALRINDLEAVKIAINSNWQNSLARIQKKKDK